MTLTQCPISYGFYQSRDFTPTRAALVLEELTDLKAGLVPPYEHRSALYNRLIRYARNQVAEREHEQFEAIQNKGK